MNKAIINIHVQVLCGPKFHPFGLIEPKILLLHHRIRICLALLETTRRSSKVAAPVCIPTSTEQEFLWFHILASSLYCHCWWILVNNPLSWGFHGCSASCCSEKTWINQRSKVYFSLLWSSIVMGQVALLSPVIQRPGLSVALPSSVGLLSRSLFSWTSRQRGGNILRRHNHLLNVS